MVFVFQKIRKVVFTSCLVCTHQILLICQISIKKNNFIQSVLSLKIEPIISNYLSAIISLESALKTPKNLIVYKSLNCGYVQRILTNPEIFTGSDYLLYFFSIIYSDYFIF